ncbi:unnamed protein product [Adineta steineri]|uniref:SKI-interacting protein SKIP SNW domain-containing protein n=1 Tax=Adineta steineri TaxID=433720 RepID=A0A813YMX0_9BILA|nr:unnamed protein product [Adineta steineri]
MVEVQKDPMEPPRFKINKKLPRGPPSPPAPILHSPTRKVTVKEQQDWKIPPCISNWKNSKGYTIPLDKRLAADGRGLQSTHINENFAKLAEALYTADLKAREAVDMRAKVEKQIAKKQKDDKEERLRELALHARTDRAGIRLADKGDEQSAERDQIRQERNKERQRAAALQRAGGDKKRPKERDISEQIALGVQSATNTGVQYDQRLFNMSAGLNTGLGDDEAYNVYDQPWNSSTAVASQIYKPTKTSKDNFEDTEALATAATRFEKEKGFKGADRATARDGPVQFQREEDPFGLTDFLKDVRHGGAGGSAPSANPSSSSSSKRGYTIPLDKRLAVDGRGLQNTHINENFAKLAEALYTANSKAHEAVDLRAKVEKQIAKKQKDDKEERLRKLALRARTDHVGIRLAGKGDEQSAERDQIRQERKKERRRAAALQRAGGNKKNRPKERDISEKIALGVQSAIHTGIQYDQRLFNMSAGFNSGLSDDGANNVYDRPWNSSTAVASQIYKPSKTSEDNFEDTEALANATTRFEKEKGFKGASRAAARNGPVQFQHEEDLFSSRDFLKDVRQSGTSGSASSSKRGNADDREERSSKKRLDGRGLQNTHINENFAKLAEALYTANSKAHEAVDLRAKVEKQIAKKQKDDKEERLRELALRARTDHAGIRLAGEGAEQSAERDQIRQERKKERRRAAALQRAGGNKKNRPKQRDISEKIALGVQSAIHTGIQYDQRLFNMSAGFNSGLSDEGANNVYDRPWNSSTAVASQIYKPTKTSKDKFEDTEALANATTRFEKEKGFKGASRAAARNGPVQFQHEEDLFSLRDFLKDVRHGGASGSTSSSKRGNADDREERSSKRRRKK